MIGFLIISILSAIIAASKGFKWNRWIFALSFIGLICVIVLKRANEEGLSQDEVTRRKEKANTFGSWLSLIQGLLFLGTILFGSYN